MTPRESLKIFDEKMEEIKVWNEETFPDATLGGQLEKLEEEITECRQASNIEDMRKERADVFIVLAGLRRWESMIGKHFENDLIENTSIEKMAELYADVDAKMEINRNRVWKKTGNGKFHHEEKKK